MHFLGALLDIVLICASFFGIYLAARQIHEKRNLFFYNLWIVSTSLIFLVFLIIKIDFFSEYRILYRVFQPFFFLGPGCIYLHFMKKMKVQPKPIDYLLHGTPFFVSAIFTVKLLLEQHDHILAQIAVFQKQINDVNYTYHGIPFYSEAVMHIVRIALTVLYIVVIHRKIRNYNNAELSAYWGKIFLPQRINAGLMILTFATPLVFKLWLKFQYPDFWIIIPSMLISGSLYFWHLLMSIRQFDNTVASAPSPESAPVVVIPIAKENNILVSLPSNLLAAILEIYKNKLYLNPLFATQDIAEKHGFDNQKFSLEFNKHLPFTFASYVNYLRLLHFEINGNAQFTMEANISASGFNSRATYYQWIKRKEKLDSVMQPYIEAISTHHHV